MSAPVPEGPIGRLQDRVAIVTGSSSGIGRAIALLFANEGAQVVCADIRESSVNEAEDGATTNTTAELIDALFVRTDVSNAEDMQNLIRATVEKYNRLDILVNNAGIAIETTDPRPIWAADEDIFDLTHRVNTKGVFLGCKFASLQMRDQIPHLNGDRGSIVNIASFLSLVGEEKSASNSAANGAITALTRTVALDCAPDRIHVNAICPGYTLTAPVDRALSDQGQRQQLIEMHPFRGFGIPDDIARVALFLASEDAGWMTGACLPVDGGYTAR